MKLSQYLGSRLSRQILLVVFGVLLLAILLAFIVPGFMEQKEERVIAFIGRQSSYEDNDSGSLRLKKDYDQFHYEVLQHHLDVLNGSLSDEKFILRYFSNDERPEISKDIFENAVADDPSIVLVVDNTWGQELQQAAEIVKERRIPVISLNADKGEKDFGDYALFLGADDGTPRELVNFLVEVLEAEEVTFVTEERYPLQHSFRQLLGGRGIEIVEDIELPDVPKGEDVTDVLDGMAGYYGKAGPKRPIVLNVHGDWGDQLLNGINGRFADVTVIAGGSAVNENFKETFGVDDRGRDNGNRFFVTYSATNDSMSEEVHEDRERFKHRFAEFIDRRNEVLFLDRVHDAVALIRYAIDRRSEPSELQGKSKSREEAGITRSIFVEAFGDVPDACIETKSDLLWFDEESRRRLEIVFFLYDDGEGNSFITQLNSQGEPIPNIRMGIQVTNIFDIDLRNGDFGADFFYWTEAKKGLEEAQKPITFIGEEGVIVGSNVSKVGSRNGQLMLGVTVEDTEEKPIIFKNLKELNLSEKSVEGPKVKDSEEIYTLHRLSGRFYTQFNFADYPLDRQHLRLEAEVINPTELVRLSFDRVNLEQEQVASGAVKVDEWEIESFYITVDNEMSKSLYGRNFSQKCSQKFKHLTAHIIVKRNFWDSVLTVVLPLVLIGVVAISILFVRDLSFQNLGNAAVGIFLGIIAYLIALADIAPDMSQISRAGVLFWATFVVVVAVLIVLVIANSGWKTGVVRELFYRRARLVIPLLYFLVVILTPLL